MPFAKGNPYANNRKGKTKDQSKSIWLLESLQAHGFDYEAVLVKLMAKATKGDRHALDMAHLLVKMVPYIANAPKTDHAVVEIDTLVINRLDSPVKQSIDATVIPDGHPPLVSKPSALNIPSQSKDI